MEENKTRYFFVSAIGKQLMNGNLSVNNFSHYSNENYPSMKDLINSHNEKFPNISEVIIMGVTELSKTDWESFVSNQ